MESNAETCNMTLENMVTGATHLELSKTDVGGARYAFFGHDVHLFVKSSGKAVGGKKRVKTTLLLTSSS